MKTPRRLVGATALSLAAAAYLTGAGSASASCIDSVDCVVGPGGGQEQAMVKIEQAFLKFETTHSELFLKIADKSSPNLRTSPAWELKIRLAGQVE